MSITLISHVLCPYVQRAVIALQEKGARYERVDIDLDAKPDWFAAISPLGKTPVLRVDGGNIFESAVICEFLDETIQPALHPSDPLRRAQHRAWIEFASATLNSIWMFYTAKDEAAYEIAAVTLRHRFAQVEKELKDGPYFDGKNFSLVDAAFAPVFRYFDLFDKALDQDLFDVAPRVKAWRAVVSNRRSVQEAVAHDYEAKLREFVVSRRGWLGSLLEQG